MVPALPWAAGALFAASFALTRLAFPFALLPALLLAYASPALMLGAVGEAGAPDPLAWLSLLAGPIVASSDWSRWHTPRLWTPVLAMWALTIAVTWPIVAGREIDFSLIAAATLDTPNGLLAPPPPIAAATVTGTALGQLLGILWLDLLWQRFGTDRLERHGALDSATAGAQHRRGIDGRRLSTVRRPDLAAIVAMVGVGSLGEPHARCQFVWNGGGDLGAVGARFGAPIGPLARVRGSRERASVRGRVVIGLANRLPRFGRRRGRVFCGVAHGESNVARTAGRGCGPDRHDGCDRNGGLANHRKQPSSASAHRHRSTSGRLERTACGPDSLGTRRLRRRGRTRDCRVSRHGCRNRVVQSPGRRLWSQRLRSGARPR